MTICKISGVEFTDTEHPKARISPEVRKVRAKEASKRYYEANKDKLRQYSKEYSKRNYEQNKERKRENTKKWIAEHPERFAELVRKNQERRKALRLAIQEVPLPVTEETTIQSEAEVNDGRQEERIGEGEG